MGRGGNNPRSRYIILGAAIGLITWSINATAVYKQFFSPVFSAPTGLPGILAVGTLALIAGALGGAIIGLVGGMIIHRIANRPFGLALGWAVIGIFIGTIGLCRAGNLIRGAILGAMVGAILGSLGEARPMYESDQIDQIRPPKWFFWPLWVLASALGWFVGVTICNAMGLGATNSSQLGLLAVFIREPIYGVAVGTSQWLVLRNSLSRSGMWILAWIAGLLVGGLIVESLIFSPLSLLMSSVYLNLIIMAIVSGILGGVVGVAQWLVLRRRVRLTILWIPFAIWATSMSDVIRDIVISPVWSLSFIFQYLAIVTSGALTEMVMGLLLFWSLEDSAPKLVVQQSVGVGQ